MVNSVFVIGIEISETLKAPLESQAQGTSLFTSAVENQRDPVGLHL